MAYLKRTSTRSNAPGADLIRERLRVWEEITGISMNPETAIAKLSEGGKYWLTDAFSLVKGEPLRWKKVGTEWTLTGPATQKTRSFGLGVQWNEVTKSFTANSTGDWERALAHMTSPAMVTRMVEERARAQPSPSSAPTPVQPQTQVQTSTLNPRHPPISSAHRSPVSIVPIVSPLPASSDAEKREVDKMVATLMKTPVEEWPEEWRPEERYYSFPCGCKAEIDPTSTSDSPSTSDFPSTRRTTCLIHSARNSALKIATERKKVEFAQAFSALSVQERKRWMESLMIDEPRECGCRPHIEVGRTKNGEIGLAFFHLPCPRHKTLHSLRSFAVEEWNRNRRSEMAEKRLIEFLRKVIPSDLLPLDPEEEESQEAEFLRSHRLDALPDVLRHILYLDPSHPSLFIRTLVSRLLAERVEFDQIQSSPLAPTLEMWKSAATKVAEERKSAYLTRLTNSVAGDPDPGTITRMGIVSFISSIPAYEKLPPLAQFDLTNPVYYTALPTPIHRMIITPDGLIPKAILFEFICSWGQFYLTSEIISAFGPVWE